MKKCLVVSAALALLIACSSEPSTPSGTLPDVQNLQIDENASRGDTVVLFWDAVDVTVDGYHIYFATTMPGSWSEFISEDTTYAHIATTTGYYQVKASEGLNYSAGFSNRVDTRAESALNEREMRVGTESNGLVFYDNGTGWGLGCADSMDFAQDVYIDTVGNMLYLFSGNFDPVNYPGGNDTKLCPRGAHGRLAPEPGSTEWVDSVQVTDFDWVFVQLSNDHYAELNIDSVFTDGADLLSYEYQLIDFLRLFNVL
ncbi:MAG: hypothetical protein AVO35_06595 [Candidatus Aegiribacteria sp. MLS_C]|nr:MAG: hypothetical protein AVO35_06595 [Candidatus Aegiribacteria sp. MLS_C]